MAASRPTSFGNLLRELRVAAGLTQEELAGAAGVSIRGISDLERGVNLAPRSYTLRRLADALHLSPQERSLLSTAARAATPASTCPRGQGRVGDGQGRKQGNFLGAEPSGRLVARLDELANVRLALEAAGESSGRTVLLTGEPGVGKTRLAQEVARLAEEMGFLVAAGRCHEGETRVPFYAFREALTALHDLAPESLRRALPQQRPQLSRFLEHGESLPALPAREGEEQQQLFRAVTGFLQDLARLQPVALLLDDLHWADPSGLRLLLHIARFTRGDRILLLGNCRPEEPVTDPDDAVAPGPVLQHVLDALHREGLSERLEVRRLCLAETSDLMAEILGGAVSPDFAGQVHRATGGNPFFIHEMVRTVTARGEIERHEDGWIARGAREDGDPGYVNVPETVRAAISERLLRLDPQAQDILYAASVLGEQFAFADLVEMCRRLPVRSPDDPAELCVEIEVERALSHAIGINLVHALQPERGALPIEGVLPDAERFAFSHALTRQALYVGLSLHRRRALHRAAAAALAAGADAQCWRRVVERAWHARQGGDREQALPLVVQAGDQAVHMNAHEEAAAHYRTALRLAQDLGETTCTREILEKLAMLLRRMRSWSEALAVVDELVELQHAAGDIDGEGRALIHLGEIHRRWGTPAIGLERLSMIYWTVTAGALPATAAGLGVTLSRLSFACGRYEESGQYAEDAAVVARELPASDPRRAGLEASAEVRWGTALELLGHSQEARRHLEHGIALADGSEDPVLLAEGLNNLAVVYESLGRWEDVGRCAQRLLAAEECINSPYGLGWALLLAGAHAAATGAWQEARAHYERAARVYQDIPEFWFAPYAPLHVAALALDMGERETGLATLATALETLRANHDLTGIRTAEIILAQLDLLEGRAGEAVHRLEELRAGNGGETREVLRALPLLAEAYLAGGKLSRAKQVLELAASHAAEGKRGLLPGICRVRALVAVHEERWASAESAFAEALAHLEGDYGAYERARTLHDYGLMDVERGRVEEAKALLTEALGIFQRLGAQPQEERTARLLASLEAA